MADFLNDYSGIAGAGQAFGSFAQAFSDAQDKKMKRIQQQAEMSALQTRLQREGVDQQLKAYKDGVTINDPSTPQNQPPADAAPGLPLGPEDALAAADAKASAPSLPPKPLITERPLSNREQEQQTIGTKEKGLRPKIDKSGKVVNNASGLPDYEWDPTSPQVIGAKNKGLMLGMRNDQFQTRETDKHNAEWAKLSDKINNPAGRTAIGRYQQNLDKVETLNKFDTTLGLKPGERPPENETPEQKVQRYNRASPQDLYEVAKAADQLLSNGAATVYGTGHMMPSDMGMAAAQIQQWVTNKQAPANSGAFIAKFMNMAQREGEYYKQARDKVAMRVGAGSSQLKALDPERWETIMGGTTAPMEQQQQAPQGLVNPQGLVPQGKLGSAAPPIPQAPPAASHPEANAAQTWASGVLSNPQSSDQDKQKAQAILSRLGVQ